MSDGRQAERERARGAYEEVDGRFEREALLHP